jgi:hypothetical protein
LLAQRDLSKERFERLSDQQHDLDKLLQAQSVRFLAGALLEKYPDAAVLRIRENEDGENNYEPVSVIGSDGKVIDGTDTDDDWKDDIDGDNAPTVRDLVWDLDIRNDAWAEGFGTFSGKRNRDFRTVDIDLAVARNAPLPRSPETADPYQRTFTEEEQKALVDAAYEGVSEMNDKLTERAGDYSAAELAAIQDGLDAATKVLLRDDDI